MGLAITWCGFRDHHTQEFLKELGLSVSDKIEAIPQSRIALAKLSAGWNVLWYDRPNEQSCPFLSAKKMPELSKARELVLCSVEEHAMFSSAELWINGEQHWTISHDGSEDPGGLKSYGETPDCYQSLKREMELQQMEADRAEEGVDYIFEVPLLVAKELVGFKHDESHDTFTQLRGTDPGKISRFPFNQFSKWFSSL